MFLITREKEEMLPSVFFQEVLNLFSIFLFLFRRRIEQMPVLRWLHNGDMANSLF